MPVQTSKEAEIISPTAFINDHATATIVVLLKQHASSQRLRVHSSSNSCEVPAATIDACATHARDNHEREGWQISGPSHCHDNDRRPRRPAHVTTTSPSDGNIHIFSPSATTEAEGYAGGASYTFAAEESNKTEGQNAIHSNDPDK